MQDNVDMTVITDEASRALNQFHNLKYIIREISKDAGVSLEENDETAITLAMLQTLLGNDKLVDFLDKMGSGLKNVH